MHAPTTTTDFRRILVLGGLTRLASLYRTATNTRRIVVECTASKNLKDRLRSVDAVVLIPTKISHSTTRIVRDYSRRHGIVLVHAAGASVAEVRRTIERAAMATAH